MTRNGSGRRYGMCVLTFHRVVGEPEWDHDITWRSFRRLLDSLAGSDSPVETGLGADASLRKPAVALTFDDGTEDHVRVGEELALRGFAGIFFVPAGKVGTSGRLTLEQLLKLQALGHVLGSHSFSEVPLRRGMPDRELKRELGDSKTFLEDAVGARVAYFAPPGGIGCRWLRGELERYGYRASRSMVWGIYDSPRERWTIPCIPVTELTVARGWVRGVLCAHALPLAMRSAWTIKSMMPGPARVAMRKMLHRALKSSNGTSEAQRFRRRDNGKA
jgi:Polysaccharide deacetylase